MPEGPRMMLYANNIFSRNSQSYARSIGENPMQLGTPAPAGGSQNELKRLLKRALDKHVLKLKGGTPRPSQCGPFLYR